MKKRIEHVITVKLSDVYDHATDTSPYANTQWAADRALDEAINTLTEALNASMRIPSTESSETLLYGGHGTYSGLISVCRKDNEALLAAIEKSAFRKICIP